MRKQKAFKDSLLKGVVHQQRQYQGCRAGEASTQLPISSPHPLSPLRAMHQTNQHLLPHTHTHTQRETYHASLYLVVSQPRLSKQSNSQLVHTSVFKSEAVFLKHKFSVIHSPGHTSQITDQTNTDMYCTCTYPACLSRSFNISLRPTISEFLSAFLERDQSLPVGSRGIRPVELALRWTLNSSSSTL
jgi:hypothetical protein